jgi:hypothetical protein
MSCMDLSAGVTFSKVVDFSQKPGRGYPGAPCSILFGCHAPLAGAQHTAWMPQQETLESLQACQLSRQGIPNIPPCSHSRLAALLARGVQSASSCRIETAAENQTHLLGLLHLVWALTPFLVLGLARRRLLPWRRRLPQLCRTMGKVAPVAKGTKALLLPAEAQHGLHSTAQHSMARSAQQSTA